jgi:hypothetical protein
MGVVRDMDATAVWCAKAKPRLSLLACLALFCLRCLRSLGLACVPGLRCTVELPGAAQTLWGCLRSTVEFSRRIADGSMVHVAANFMLSRDALPRRYGQMVLNSCMSRRTQH